MNKTHISDLDYHLPKSSIAQDPYKNPEDSKILDAESMTIHQFENIDNVIPNRSLLIFNNSQVIDVRVKTIKKHTHGKVEIFILKIVDEYSADCLLKFNGKKKIGEEIELENFSINIIQIVNDGFRIKFSLPLEQIINNYGSTPLPPYIMIWIINMSTTKLFLVKMDFQWLHLQLLFISLQIYFNSLKKRILI